MFCCEFLSSAQLDRVRIRKAGRRSNELEFPGRQLLRTVIRKLLDQRVLARHYFRKIKTDFAANAPRLGMACQMHNLRGVKQRLRWHATAQDAQSSHFLASFDDDRLQPRRRGRSRRGVASAAAANDRYIIVVVIVRFHAGER